MEPLSISAIIVSTISALVILFNALKIKMCKSGCIQSECFNNNSVDNKEV